MPNPIPSCFLSVLSAQLVNQFLNTRGLTTKTGLTRSLTSYYLCNAQAVRADYTAFESMSTTFLLTSGVENEEYANFLKRFKEIAKRKFFRERVPQKHCQQNMWIVKPANENQGRGIQVFDQLERIKEFLAQKQENSYFIVQKYIDNPLLYNKRKFDIRCYLLITSMNGCIKGYWYQEGYVRTSGKDFTLKNLNKFIHLTNDAVQKKDDNYGKFERGNKISFEELNRFIQGQYGRPDIDFFEKIYPQMKDISRHALRSTYRNLDEKKRQNGFELYGLDFMIDDEFKVWLIEANTNPAIEICCTLLQKIIPHMLDNLFR